MKNYCINCYIEISRYAKRCRKCFANTIKGKNHYNYKYGVYCTPHYCKDCGTAIDKIGRSIRCHKCDVIYKYKSGIWNKKGQNNPMYGKHHKKSTRIKMSLIAGGDANFTRKNYYPPEYYRIKEQILKRDNYECQICNKKTEVVHHIDYNRLNNKKNNLIVLCQDHNTKVNYNRPFWIEYLQSKKIK